MSDQATPSVDNSQRDVRPLAARRILRLGIGVIALFLLAALCRATLNLPDTTRAVEPRLSAGQSYAACRPDDPQLLVPRLLCPGSQKAKIMERRRDRPAIRGPESDLESPEVLPPLSKDERTKALRDLGSNPGSVIHAAKILRQASEQNPKDARSQSDAAAALYSQAQTKQDPLPLLDAYAFAEKATKLDPALPESRFNRALIEEALGLREQARASWARYLALDPESDWSKEAQAHLDRLAPTESEDAAWLREKTDLERAAQSGDGKKVTAIVDRHRQAVREEIFERALPGWGKAVLAGEAEKAVDLLAFAWAAGNALAQLGGDRSAERAIVGIEGQNVRSQAQAFVVFGEAARLIAERDFTGAQSLLERMGSSLSSEGESLNMEVAFLRQRIAYSADRFSEQRAIGQRLLDQTSDGSSPHLRGRVFWSLGTMELLLGRPAEGIESYQAAQAEFERCGEIKNLAAVRGLLAGALAEVGDLEGSWNLRLRGLNDLKSTGDPPRLRLAASAAAFAAVDLGRMEAARAFLAEALLAARVEGRPMPIARVLLHIAEVAGRRGDPDDGLRAIAGARRVAAQIASESDRRSLEVDLFLNEGRLLVARNPMAAATRLTEAIDRYDALAYTSFRPLALAARAEADLAAGDDQAAERDLAEAIELLERTQATVPDAAYAIGFLDHVRAIYDRMIALQVDLRHRPDRALEVAEQGRARRLRDQLASVPGSLRVDNQETLPPNAKALQAAQPPGIVALVYKDLPDRLLIWRVERDYLDLVQVPIARTDLETRVEQARQSARQDAPDALDRLAYLYDQLIRPVNLDGEAEFDLLLVTSGALSGVPFAALWDRASRRFLVERATIRFAPSLSLQPSIPDLGVSGGHDGLLVVADPSSRSFPGRLPGTRDEARAIKTAFPNAQVVEGEEATPEEVLRRLPEVSIVHFAAHAVADSRSPFLSYLVLAPSTSRGDSGYLYAKDLFGPRLPKLRLAVLSACNTAGKYTSASEGLVGLTWPFLARGARNVVASLWETEDRSSAELFSRFYHELSLGTDTATALRVAQTGVIEKAKLQTSNKWKIDDWGAFEILGSNQSGTTDKEKR